MMDQILLGIFSCSAIWFLSRKEQWSRWGYILGLISQPFWFYSSYINKQWAIFILSFFLYILFFTGDL